MRASNPSNIGAPSATFQCALCPRRYTRAFNLRNHLRTHTEERPFVCGVCEKAFTRNHDRKTHEQLHSGEKIWVCGGTLKNGEHWGCGWRYARKSNLQRHLRSDLGRRCIKPLRNEESAERNTTTGLMNAAKGRERSDVLDLTQPQPRQANAEHSAATTLTEIARTLDKETLQGLENGGDTSWSLVDIHERIRPLENIVSQKGFNVAMVSRDPSRMSKARPMILLPASASVPIPISQRDTVFNAEPAAIGHSKVLDENSLFYGVQQKMFGAGQRLDPALTPGSEDPAKNDNKKGLSIPVEHTTAAHKLLIWPSIKRLLSSEYHEDYAMRLEEERGLISLYGQGEISCTADDTQLPTLGFDQAKSNPDGTSKMQSAASSSDADEEIDRFDLLKLDGKTARRYYQSYLDRMYKLHPFLSQSELGAKVDAFIRCYCPRTASPTTEPNTLCREKKRKRSHEDLHCARGGSVDPPSASLRPRVRRNIDNVIIMLVFALGAICECKSPLPGPIREEKANFEQHDIPRPLDSLRKTLSNGTHAANGVLSPANPDSALPTTSSFYGMLQTTSQSFQSSTIKSKSNLKEKLTRRTISSARDEFGHVKNLQVIPGLALYRFATTILGNLQGVKLEHIQAGLLAGLYAGQLAHPIQSHRWICQATRACEVLVRPERYERLEEGAQQDLHNFAYWTCLQLESDLAELDIPASGVSRSEGRIDIPIPRGLYTIAMPNDLTAPGTMMMMYYSAQISLCNMCNSFNHVYSDLDKVEKHGQIYWSPKVQVTLGMNLDLWRISLPVIMKWEDTDPPATDINAARMRAKYYGARYIIHQPLLCHVLHYGQTGVRVDGSMHMQPMLNEFGIEPSNPFSSFPQGWNPPTVNLRELPYQLRRACRICVESAILSTQAFDGIEDRLIVPNIVGTAHAQFGNMLVLSATYASSLSELIERSTLERLLKRTIRFLLSNKNISPTLRADARILSEIYEKIFRSAPVLGNDGSRPILHQLRSD